MILSGDFTFITQYLLMPFGGCAIALVFYEFVFVKSQEYLADDNNSSDEGIKDLSLPDGLDSPPSKEKKPLQLDNDIEDEEENKT